LDIRQTFFGGYMDSIGNRLKEERARIGITQEKMALAGGIQKRAQARYEAGERCPDGHYLSLIAELGIDVNYVLTGRRTAANNEDSFSSEDLQLLRLINLLAPEQKNETVEDIRKTAQRNQSVVSHWVANQGRHQAAMA
jgi:transcriptional regulator with XRE-family HTH domain